MLYSDTQEKDMGERAKDVVNCMAIVIKTAQLHHVNNIAVVNAIHKFLEILNPLLSSEKITLQLIEEFFNLNGSRIRYSVEYSSNFDFIIEVFKKTGLGAIIIEETLTEDNIKAFLAALKTAELSDMPFQTLYDELVGVPHIKIVKFRKIKD